MDPNDFSWQTDDAPCKHVPDPSIFFPNGNDPRLVQAKRVCLRCPRAIKDACLAFALEHDEQGVWGGTSERQRRDMRRRQVRVLVVAS